MNPFYDPDIGPQMALAAFGLAMVLVLGLTSHRVGSRVGVLIAGLFLAAPCFVQSTPLIRGLLMCLMFVPFFAAIAFLGSPPIRRLPDRLASLCAWSCTRPVGRCPPRLDARSLFQLLASTGVFAATLAVVRAVPASGFWLPARWLAGGIMFFGVAEMITASFALVGSAFGVNPPPVMQSPWRSACISEFWAKRWNIFASQKVLHPYCFVPLARRSVALGVWAAFILSGIGHALLALMALGRWKISVCCGLFFVVQPLLIAAERRFGVRRWSRAAARTWTLVALAITCPLFIEPALQIIRGSWGKPASIFKPIITTTASIFIFSSMVALLSLACLRGRGRSGTPVRAA